MLSQLHVLHRVKHWKEINASVFVTLFEGLWGEPLKGMFDVKKNTDVLVWDLRDVLQRLVEGQVVCRNITLETGTYHL